jgi:hypothetical protein
MRALSHRSDLVHSVAVTLWATLAVAGCADGTPPAGSGSADVDADEPEVPPAWCEGATGHRWVRDGAEEIDLFPDGLLEVADASTPTGVRLSVDPERAPWVGSVPPFMADAADGLSDLSGFGTTGGVLLRFDAPVTAAPGSAEESVESAGWMLVDLDTPDLARVPFEARVVEDGLTVMLWPLRPMRSGARHALVLTTAAEAADGGCISPTDTTRALLYGTSDDPVVAEAAPRYRAALDDLGLRPDDVSVVSVFTTHDDTDVLRDLAAAESSVPVS